MVGSKCNRFLVDLEAERNKISTLIDGSPSLVSSIQRPWSCLSELTVEQRTQAQEARLDPSHQLEQRSSSQLYLHTIIRTTHSLNYYVQR
uniref:Uncharacterized protein n=1 Tax=Timema cristinae TaxID=61476 RepID=A0A7R9DAA5_TIMCR|nr:unnamed protein product [Timema cristinae]